MTNCVERVTSIDGSQVKAGKNSGLKEDSLINGYVTVIKNVGKSDEQVLCKDKHNLLTTDGRDFFHAQVYTNTSTGTRGANFIALTTDSSGADAGDTTLPSEITTGGLARAVATTITHTNDSNVTTLVKTFTASATHTAVQMSGTFNAASGATLAHEAVFTAVTLVSSDTLQVTWTLTLG
jgi:hypothetical protein